MVMNLSNEDSYFRALLSENFKTILGSQNLSPHSGSSWRAPCPLPHKRQETTTKNGYEKTNKICKKSFSF